MKRFYVLTGPPGAGKTSLLQALNGRVSVVAEPARRVLAAERACGGDGTGDQNPARFIELMRQMAVRDYQAANGVTVFDRALPDLFGFCAYYKINADAIRTSVERCAYHKTVFWLPGWEAIYATDNERTLNFEEAQAFGALTKAGYEARDYQLVTVPKLSIPERADFILQSLKV